MQSRLGRQPADLRVNLRVNLRDSLRDSLGIPFDGVPGTNMVKPILL
jgi:hypothetical protein